jgi:ABC-type thiamine transport system substrate-binding protein
MKYAQRFILDNNGRKGAITSTGYDKELAAETAITCIGGSWSLNAVTKALGGAENVGVTELPIFTLTEADEYGAAKAGMQFHSGSFVDCKVLVKKANSACAEYLDDIIKFLTSDDIQRRSYEECANQPASKNIVTDTELSLAQVAQASYGIPQPFGVKAKYNTYYYSKGAPDLYVAICQNTDAKYSSDASILKTLQTASYIWAKGKNPTDDAELASWVAGK